MRTQPFENHCADSTQFRCIGCPVDILGDVDDRVDAGTIVHSVLHYPGNREWSDGSEVRVRRGVDQLVEAVDEMIEEFGKPQLTGAVLGAVAVKAADECKQPE